MPGTAPWEHAAVGLLRLAGLIDSSVSKACIVKKVSGESLLDELLWRSACVLGMAAMLSACIAVAGGRSLSVVGPAGGSMTVSIAGPGGNALGASPTVVLQSGLGDSRAPWARVAREVAIRHQVFSYDRPGYGGSDSVAGARDPCSVAAELHELLKRAGIRPPYLLVGHSLGGLYHHAFARMYPQEVSGVLLLDPTHPDHIASLKIDAPARAAAAQGMHLILFGAAATREFDDQALCRERLVGPPQRPVPTRVLVSTRRGPLEEGAFADMLERMRTDWLHLTGAPRLERVADSGHYLQVDQPEVVAAAIKAMADRATSP